MDSVRAMLDLESAASEVELLEALKQLMVKLLKDLCWEKSLKFSGNKAEVIGRLLSYWAHSFADDSDEEHSAAPSGSSAVAELSGCCEMPSFRQIRTWNKDLSYLRNFSFRQLYEYLVNSKDKTFDKKSMKAYKSLKTCKYFKDGFVRNVWSNSHKETQLVAVRASGDGIIKNHHYHGENPGVLEIKCPFWLLDKIQVTQKTTADITTEHKSFFLEYDGDERLRLKTILDEVTSTQLRTVLHKFIFLPSSVPTAARCTYSTFGCMNRNWGN